MTTEAVLRAMLSAVTIAVIGSHMKVRVAMLILGMASALMLSVVGVVRGG